MEHACKALIIALDDVPGEYDDYETACRALKLEPNGHTYLVCLVSTAAGPRTLLTVDLGLLPEIGEAGTSGQASSSGTDRSKQTASGTGALKPRPFGYPPHRAPSPVDPGLPGQVPQVPPEGQKPSGHVPQVPPEGQKPNQFRDFCSLRPARPGGRLADQPQARRPDRPHVVLVLDLDRATLKGTAVWNPKTGQLGTVSKAEDAVIAALRETLADTSAQAAVDKLWPVRAPSPGLADLDTAVTALQAVLEPQTLLLKMINATARIAAAHAGMALVAPWVGQFAENLCRPYVRTPRDSIMTVLTCVDIDLYAAAGELPNSATLHQLTVEEASLGIEKLFSDWFEVETPGHDPGPAENRPVIPPDPGDPGPGGPSPVLSARQTASLPAVARAPGSLVVAGGTARTTTVPAASREMASRACLTLICSPPGAAQVYSR